jgi:hypothetical protein
MSDIDREMEREMEREVERQMELRMARECVPSLAEHHHPVIGVALDQWIPPAGSIGWAMLTFPDRRSLAQKLRALHRLVFEHSDRRLIWWPQMLKKPIEEVSEHDLAWLLDLWRDHAGVLAPPRLPESPPAPTPPFTP